MNKKDMENIAKGHSLMIIGDECATLYDLLQNHDALFNIQILPYVALYYDSTRDFFKVNIQTDIDLAMKDIRNNLKLFNETYSHISKRIEQEDVKQNEYFENPIDKSLTKSLGLFFVDDRKIIGNTYLSNIELNMSDLEEDEWSSYSYSLGYVSGQLLGTLYETIKDNGFEFLDTVNIDRKKEIKCCNINTNNNNIFNNEISKEMNIILLSILGKINFVKYYLEPLFFKNDSWLFRVRYISVYYSHRALKKVLNQLKDIDIVKYKKISSIINEDLFDTEFRNYTMHYGLLKGDKFIVSEDNFDETKLWVGLVEDCFGKTYKEYFAELLTYREIIETFISELFNWDEVVYDN